MSDAEPVSYEVDGRIARITLDRPERGNGITRGSSTELADVRRARRPRSGRARDAALGQRHGLLRRLRPRRERRGDGRARPRDAGAPAGSPLDPAVIAANHDPRGTWDPMVDYAMMSRNVRGFMSLFHADKPVVCMVHGFCVAGGTDMALCSDLLVIEDEAKIGYPPARVWGSPTTALWAHRVGAQRAKRLLFTGDRCRARRRSSGDSRSRRRRRSSCASARRSCSRGSRACRSTS